jgi:hypothetical protein
MAANDLDQMLDDWVYNVERSILSALDAMKDDLCSDDAAMHKHTQHLYPTFHNQSNATIRSLQAFVVHVSSPLRKPPTTSE